MLLLSPPLLAAYLEGEVEHGREGEEGEEEDGEDDGSMRSALTHDAGPQTSVFTRTSML